MLWSEYTASSQLYREGVSALRVRRFKMHCKKEEGRVLAVGRLAGCAVCKKTS